MQRTGAVWLSVGITDTRADLIPANALGRSEVEAGGQFAFE